MSSSPISPDHDSLCLGWDQASSVGVDQVSALSRNLESGVGVGFSSLGVVQMGGESRVQGSGVGGLRDYGFSGAPVGGGVRPKAEEETKGVD